MWSVAADACFAYATPSVGGSLSASVERASSIDALKKVARGPACLETVTSYHFEIRAI